MDMLAGGRLLDYVSERIGSKYYKDTSRALLKRTVTRLIRQRERSPT